MPLPPPWELQGGPRGPNPAHNTHPPLHPRPRKPSVSSGVSVRPRQTAADTWELPGSPLPHLNPGTSRRAPFCALPHPPLQPRQQAARLVLPKRPRGAPSPSGGRLLAQASRHRALFLHTVPRAHNDTAHAECPHQLRADPNPRSPVLCVPSAQEGRRPAGISGTLAPVLSGWAASGQSPSQCLQGSLLPGLSAPKSAPPISGEWRLQKAWGADCSQAPWGPAVTGRERLG